MDYTHVDLTAAPHPPAGSETVTTEDIQECVREAIKPGTTSNHVLSAAAPVFGSDEDVIVWEPADVGKTTIAVLAILRDLVAPDADPACERRKVIYIAPMNPPVQKLVWMLRETAGSRAARR